MGVLPCIGLFDGIYQQFQVQLFEVRMSEFRASAEHAIDDLQQSAEYSDMTDEEIQQDVLKAAIVNPELYNTMRQLMIGHPYPNRLDEHAQRLRRIFMELESHGTHR